MIGTTLAHYRITSALGAGGMGEVWRAEDEKLGREVALKVLPAEFADDTERLDRFEREARAVASLNHPHIVTIFSVEDAGGIRFLTMELVDGQTLDSMIPEHGFDAETFFELATPLAEAISAAHDKSVDPPRPQTLERHGRRRRPGQGAGLRARQAPGARDEPPIPTNSPPRPSPVSARSWERCPTCRPSRWRARSSTTGPISSRSGVLFYEMATGERPFQGESSPGLMSSILKDAPAPVVEMPRRSPAITSAGSFPAVWRRTAATATRPLVMSSMSSGR